MISDQFFFDLQIIEIEEQFKIARLDIISKLLCSDLKLIRLSFSPDYQMNISCDDCNVRIDLFLFVFRTSIASPFGSRPSMTNSFGGSCISSSSSPPTVSNGCTI